MPKPSPISGSSDLDPEDELPVFDMTTWSTEEAVRYMVEELDEVESRARFMVALAKGEISGDVVFEDETAQGDEPISPEATKAA